VNRQFEREGPSRLWMTDITEPTQEGKIYCCAVLDAWSRKVVGWSIEKYATTAMVNTAIAMATTQRAPSKGALIHTDHGPQGGFKWSSQHFDVEVCDGKTSRVDDRVDGAVGNEVAWRAFASA